jgi:hypothetical protein
VRIETIENWNRCEYNPFNLKWNGREPRVCGTSAEPKIEAASSNGEREKPSHSIKVRAALRVSLGGLANISSTSSQPPAVSRQ